MGRYSSKCQLEGLFLKLVNNCLLFQRGKMGILYMHFLIVFYHHCLLRSTVSGTILDALHKLGFYIFLVRYFSYSHFIDDNKAQRAWVIYIRSCGCSLSDVLVCPVSTVFPFLKLVVCFVFAW